MNRYSFIWPIALLVIVGILLFFALTNDFINEIAPIKYSFVIIGVICALIGLYSLYKAIK